jgi:adenine-specific DNA-methyltransferase
MIKDIIEQNDNTTPNSKQLAVLKENFPACFKVDGSFDIERFKAEISSTSHAVQEGYELKFLGKSYAKLLASTESTTVIQPNENHNSLPENAKSENIYISGDNLDGLKHLLKSYNGEINCIYIDPPYNTGTDGFVYFDNFNYNKETLQEKLSVSEEEAVRILDLTKRGSASHSAWLMFMYSRLLLARDLLKDDGVIFISIDDNEQANLKLLCDDVFGEENLIAQIVIQSNKRGQTYKQLAKTHEYLLVYVRSESSIINELKKEISGSTKTDDVGDFSERELRNRNPKYGRFNRPNLFYPIYINPSIIDANGYSPTSLEKSSDYSIEVLPLNSEASESCWRWGTKKFLKNSEANTMLSNVVGRIKTTGEYGIYEKYRKGTYKAKTIWFADIEIVDDEENDEDEILDYIGIERIKRAAAKIKQEHPDKILDLGFKHYILSEPNQNTLDKLDRFDKAGLLADTSILDDFGKPTILATWLNADGYGLAVNAENIDLAGYTAYYCQKHLYLIDPSFTLESMKALLSKYDAEGHFNPENLVLFGYSFPDWSINEMIEKNLRILNDGEKNLKINFTVRY